MKKILPLFIFIIMINQLSATIEDETFSPNQEKYIVKAYDTFSQDTVYDTNTNLYAGRDDGFPEEAYDDTRMVGYSSWFFNSSEYAVDSINIEIEWSNNKNLESWYYNKDSTAFRDDSLFIRAKAVTPYTYYYLTNEAMYDTIRSWKKYHCVGLDENYNTDAYNPYVTDDIPLGGDDELTQLVRDAIRDGKDLYFGFELDPDSVNNKYLGQGSIEITIYYNEVTLANRYAATSALLGDSLSVDHLTMDKYDFTVLSGDQVSTFVGDNYNIETHEQIISTYQHHDWDNEDADYKLIRENYPMNSASEITAFYKDVYSVNIESTTGTLYIKDPWYVNPSTGEQDNPYQTVADYEVFQNQNPEFDSQYPSYKIKASAYTGGSGSYCVFHQWSTAGNTTFQSPTSYETKVCFKDTNRVTAEYWTGISVTDGTLGHDAGGYYVSYSGDRIYATTSGIYEVTGWESSDNNKAQIGSGDETKCYVTFSGSTVTLSPAAQQVSNTADYTLTINSDEALSIPSGANISFASGFTLGVEGTLSCEGSTLDQIQLSGQGKDESTPFMYNYLNPTSDTLIKVINSNAEVVIKNTSFSDLPCGLRLKHLNQNVYVTNVKFIDNNVGISIDEISDSDYILDSLYFEGNDIGVAIDPEFPDISQESAISIAHSIFYNQGDCGIFLIPTGWGTTYASQLDLNIFNCTFWDIDKALYIKKPDEFNGTVRTYVTNCIFGGATQSIIEDEGPEYWLFEDNNISDSEMGGLGDEIIADPQVIDPDNQDFRLKYSSPCIDAGSYIFNEHFDIDYDPDGTDIDIGALYFPQYNFSGTIDSDTTWYGRLTVTGDVTVSSGVELTINPGSMVMFNSDKKMTVNGTLTADGTSANHIVFTRSDSSSNAKSYWDRINFASAASYTIDYVDLYGSTYGLRMYNNSGGTISNSYFNRNYIGVYLYNGDNTTVENCDMVDNTCGIYCLSSDNLSIEDNSVDSSYYYGIYMNGSDGVLFGNTIKNTSYWDGIGAFNSSGPDLSTSCDPDHVEVNNEIANNNRYGVYASSSSDIDLGTYVFIGTDYLGGFNYFDRGSGSYDVRNYNSGTVKAECNWWSSMSNYGTVDTSPTASSLGFSMSKATGNDISSEVEQLLSEAYQQEKVDSAYTKAITTLNEIAQVAPDDGNAWKVIIRLARNYRKCNDVDGLKDNLDKLYAQYPEKLIGVAALKYSAGIYSKEGNYQEAVSRLDKVIQLWQQNPQYQDIVAFTLVDQGMNYQQMDSTAGLPKASVAQKKCFDTVIEQYPETDAAWLLKNMMGYDSKESEAESLLPKEFAFHSPYPNPFNPTTTLKFDLPEAAQVSLVIYNIRGKEVWRLNNRIRNYYAAGYHQVQWNGTNKQGLPVSSGAYIVVLTTLKNRQVQKVLLMK